MEIDLDTLHELDNYFCKSDHDKITSFKSDSNHSSNVFVEQRNNREKVYITENIVTTSCVDENEYLCNICKIFFNSDLYLKNHIRDKHSKSQEEYSFSNEFEAEKNRSNYNVTIEEYLENQQETTIYPAKFEVCENTTNYVIEKYTENQEENSCRVKLEIEENETDCDIIEYSENEEENSCRVKLEIEENITDCDVTEYSENQQDFFFSDEVEEENCNIKEKYTENVHSKCAALDESFNVSEQDKNEYYTNVQHSDSQFECDLCRIVFSKKLSLRMHIIAKHLPRKKKKNIYEYFQSEKLLKSHVHRTQKSHRKKMHSCQYCDKKLWSRISLKLHEDKHRGVTYDCERCNKSFTDITSLYRHRKSAHFGFVYKCNICGLKLADDRTLLRHEKNVHNKLGIDDSIRFQCHLCSSSYIRKDSLRVHIKLHYMSKNDAEKWMKNRSQPSFCEECRHFLENKSCLKQHQKYFHLKLLKGEEVLKKEHKCSICGEMFSRKFDLIAHISCTHEKIVKWQCEFCDQIYDSRTQLNKHRSTHKVVQYNCNFCENSFFEKELLNLHIYSSHAEEMKQNECWKCKIKFRSKLCLDKHLSGENCPNQFICLDCNVTFECLDQIELHMKRCHRLCEES